MKKTIALLICISMLALSACGGSSGGAQPKQTPEEKARASLIGFLEGDVKAFTDYSEPDQSFTIKELGEYICSLTTDTESDSSSVVSDMQYAYIDCGDDGIPEMALDYTITTKYGEYTDMPNTIHFVIANTADGLKAIYYGETYYRTYTDISRYGYISSGGSYSAMGYYFDNSYINKDGELIYLNSSDFSFGYSRPVISPYDIDYLKLPDDYEDYWDFDENGYEIDKFNFTQFDENESYDEYRRGYMYVILDSSGNDALPDEHFAQFYKDNGIQFYSSDEIQDILMKHAQDLGVSEKIFNDYEPVEYTKLV